MNWFLWNVRCLRGRRCADAQANVVTSPGDPAFVVEYICAGCGTRYRWDSLTRTRRRVGKTWDVAILAHGWFPPVAFGVLVGVATWVVLALT